MSRGFYSRPTVNASLLHEFRMIFESLFRERTMQTMYQQRKQNRAAPVVVPAPALKCARCIEVTIDNSAIEDAVTIFGGTALCKKHLLVVMNTITPTR